jgi:hypothetical protein
MKVQFGHRFCAGLVKCAPSDWDFVEEVPTMASVVFTLPRHLELGDVLKATKFYPKAKLRRLSNGDYVYVCYQNVIRYRAMFRVWKWSEKRPTMDGDDKGPGWVLLVGKHERPPRTISLRGGRPKYVLKELW